MTLRFTMLALALVAGGSQAQAAKLRFTITGAYQAEWVMQDRPTITQLLDGGNTAAFFDVSGTFAGIPEGKADLRLFSGVWGGGMSITRFETGALLYDTFGPQIFTGTALNPVFAPGTYTLRQFGSGAASTLAIATPEPGTWATMAIGFGLIGGALRRRRPALA